MKEWKHYTRTHGAFKKYLKVVTDHRQLITGYWF